MSDQITDKTNWGRFPHAPAIATTHLEEYKERLLQTWMSVNAKVKYEDVSNKDLIQRDLFVNHVSPRDVNILHYILNILKNSTKKQRLKSQFLMTKSTKDIRLLFSVSLQN